MAQEKARPTRARKKAEAAPVVEGDASPLVKKPRARRQRAATVGPADVATLAYLLWEQGEPGDALEHWLRAEQEIAA